MTSAKSSPRNSRRAAPALALLLPLILGACSTLKDTPALVQSEIDHADSLRDQLRARSASSAVMVQHRSKIAGEEILIKNQEILPPVFDQQVTHVTAGQTLDETLTAISRQIGLPIWLTEFASDSWGENNARGGGQGNLPIQLQYSGTLKGLLDQLAQTAKLYWRFNEGRVEFFLYETRHHYVHLPMGARSVSSNISSSGRRRNGVAGGGNDNDSLGDINVRTDNISVDPYGAITSTITAMLLEDDGLADIVGSSNRSDRVQVDEVDGSSGGNRRNRDGRNRRGSSRVVVSPDMGMISVTAPPASQDRIADYIAQVNRRFSKNVMIDVKIYDVALNDQAGAGFSADVFYKKLGSYGLQFGRGVAGITGASPDDLELLNAIKAADNPLMEVANQVSEITTPFIDPSTGLPMLDGTGAPIMLSTNTTTPVVMPIAAPAAPVIPSRFAGSEAMARALSTFGRIASVTSGQVIAVNGQPAPLQIGSEITYLAGTETIERDAGNTSRLETRLVTERLSVGLTANFLPQILGDNRILLQYQLNSRALAGMSTIVNANGDSVQMPTVNSQTLQQQAFVRDGEAIVLFGIEQNANSHTGSQSLPLNFGRDASKDRTLRVILMQIFGGGENANR